MGSIPSSPYSKCIWQHVQKQSPSNYKYTIPRTTIIYDPLNELVGQRGAGREHGRILKQSRKNKKQLLKALPAEVINNLLNITYHF